MRACFLSMALLGSTAAALEPDEIQSLVAPATVRIECPDGGTATGVVVQLAPGRILTNAHLVRDVQTVEIVCHGGERLKASVAAQQAGSDLALLEVAGLDGAGARAVALARPVVKADQLYGRRVYSILASRGERWEFARGIAAGMRATRIAKLKGIYLVEHDLPLEANHTGSPLLDETGRLIGLNQQPWSRQIDSRGNRNFAIPVNAIQSFLGENKLADPLPADALPVRKGEQPARAREPEPVPVPDRAPEPSRPTPHSVPAPAPAPARDGDSPVVDFGLYRHILGSAQRAKLATRMAKFFNTLRGAFWGCRSCRMKGWQRVGVSHGGRYVGRWGWRGRGSSSSQRKTCSVCNGAKFTFREEKARAAFRTITPNEHAASGKYNQAEKGFIARVKAYPTGYSKTPGMRYEVDGRFAVVCGSRSNPVFPMNMQLLRAGRDYEWFLHDPNLDGAFPFGRETGALPPADIVADVISADVIVLRNGAVVRLCGVVMPLSGAQVPKGPVTLPDEEALAIVRAELLGKRVELERDKYSNMTCEGEALAYVLLDGKEYNLELIRRGIARCHPKHKHMRHSRYRKAEVEANKAGVGCWRKG